MEAIELIELINRGEDSRTQFKKGQDVNNAKSLAGEMAAFANSDGGRILIGIDNAGSVIGLSSDDIRRINQLISNTATDCVRPPINSKTENIAVNGKLIMVVIVNEGISKPYADNDGVFWVKSGADKRRVTAREEIQRMLQAADLVHADEVPVEGATIADIDLEHFSLISPGALPNNLTIENIRNGVSNIRNPFIASFATKELPYRGIGTGIRRALAAVPDIEFESDLSRSLFIARIPRKEKV